MLYAQRGNIGSGRFGAEKSDSTHHFFGNACTKSGPLRFSQFSHAIQLSLKKCYMIKGGIPIRFSNNYFII
jgi:hypothetical protein